MEYTASVKNKKSIINMHSYFSSLILILLCIILVVLLRLTFLISKNNGVDQKWSASQMREYASKLKADGLTQQAMRAFEEYIDKRGADAASRCNIYYSLGEMFLKEGQYENALSYLYKAEISNPDTDLKKEIGSYIVMCLEKMGKSLDAEYQLESRASLKGEEKQKKATGEVVAKIGLREITMGEINNEIEKLPSWMKEEYTKDESKKLEFLQQYVSGELLYDKGSKLGLTKDPEIRSRIESFSKQVVVQKVIENEISEKVHVEADDVKNYYEANKEKYKGDSGKIKDFDEVRNNVEYDYRMEKSQKHGQELLARILKSKNVIIFSEKFKKNIPAKKEENTK